jgi:hypothetical protein
VRRLLIARMGFSRRMPRPSIIGATEMIAARGADGRRIFAAYFALPK